MRSAHGFPLVSIMIAGFSSSQTSSSYDHQSYHCHHMDTWLLVVCYFMMLKRLSCFQLSNWIFSELLSPPHLLSTLPSGRMSCFVVKSSEKRPILQFEGTSYCGVRRFGLVLALSRVVSFFLGFKNQSLD